jgi:hypothetical protein
MSDTPSADSLGCGEPGPSDGTIRDRLAAARGSDEVAGILGKRRLVGYALGFAAVAIACVAASAYMVIEVAKGEGSAWTLAALPAPLFLALFCGISGYAGASFVATGRQWSKADMIGRIAGRLNSNI